MQAKIAIVSEAWGPEEEKERTAMIGATGYLLNQMLAEAEIIRADCFITNVFNLGYPGGKVEGFCGGKAEAIKGYPALLKSKYVRAEYAPELERLADELIEVNPNLIIAMGNTACWALLGRTTIKKLRGITTLSTHTVEGFKVLPTYHPAAIFRQWEVRPTTVMDLMKAKREAESAVVNRPQREIWIDPTIEDCYEFHRLYIQGCKILSVDIETAGNLITRIGFAPSTSRALVVPFFDTRRLGRSYWPTPNHESKAWQFVRRVLEDTKIAKLFQNGLYDIAFIWRTTGIKIINALHDSMLLHHALQPEALKGLGYMGSIYSDEGAWKDMRGKVQTIKRDD